MLGVQKNWRLGPTNILSTGRESENTKTIHVTGGNQQWSYFTVTLTIWKVTRYIRHSNQGYNASRNPNWALINEVSSVAINKIFLFCLYLHVMILKYWRGEVWRYFKKFLLFEISIAKWPPKSKQRFHNYSVYLKFKSHWVCIERNRTRKVSSQQVGKISWW